MKKKLEEMEAQAALVRGGLLRSMCSTDQKSSRTKHRRLDVPLLHLLPAVRK